MSKLTTIGRLGREIYREIDYHGTILHMSEFVMVERPEGNYIGIIDEIQEGCVSVSVPKQGDKVMWLSYTLRRNKKLTPCLELKPGTIITPSSNGKFDTLMRNAAIPGATWVFEGNKSILIVNPWLEEK